MFLKNLVTLFSGTALAQLIPLIISPLLARLYNPKEFGEYGIFLAILTFSSVSATLRYDFAVAQASHKKDVNKLIYLSLIVSLVFSLCLFLFSLLNYQYGFLDSYINRVYFILISLGVFFFSNVQVVSLYLNRTGNFKQTAKLKVIQAVTTSIIMVLSYAQSFNGLIIGHLIGQIVFFIVTIKLLLTYPIPRMKTLFEMLVKYKNFPIKGAPGALMNAAYLQVPILYMKSNFDSIYVGYYTIINRYLAGPLSLLSVSITQVLMSEIAKENKIFIKKLFYKILIVSFFIAFFFFAVIYFYGEFLIEVILGDEWVGLYKYLFVISFSIMARFVVSPLSALLTKDNTVRFAFYWQLLSFTLLMVLLWTNNWISFYEFLVVYVFFDVAMYICYLFFIFKGLKMVVNNE